MKIAIAGGTGTVGRLVVDEAHARGHEAVVLTRSNGVDLTTGAGAESALAGVEVVIDVLNLTTMNKDEAVSFYETTTRNLLAAEALAGVAQHVALSIVGIDTSPSGYYEGKLAQERAVKAGGVPWTILRATQFHEFAPQMFATLRRGPVMPIPVMATQPVAAREVAGMLVDLAEAAAQYSTVQLAGPAPEKLVDMVRSYGRATGQKVLYVPLRLPGASMVAMRDGTLLPSGEYRTGRESYAQWLERVTTRSA
ncbi:3-beta hydroxysteroid dehydrogenase [Pseudoclavibacter sp. AY1F1]|uniref:SDR family oxidoreductase n=1 Tax=Pseudoclavibacter sp. AY1F1 TaxID=2080583 RepID=UPI000CE82572|nr:SDR family oxidoreductase [Pseudoclavibacter sp. AY1F1]PPF46085.1 3-beta hydroxysteroid dehydrogenase [Pseudoclavibacter sp. AY1F1]